MKIKILTINVWFGGKIWDPLLEFIKKENPDIVAMQEVYNGKDTSFPKNYRSFSELKKNLDFEYAIFAPEFIDERKIGDVEIGNAIFSKLPIIKQKISFYDGIYGKYNKKKRVDFSIFPSNLQEVDITVRSIIIHLFNTHGVWGFDGEDNKKRLIMSNKIVEEIKGKKRTILAGDFNVNTNTKTIQNIENHMINVFNNELKTTFNMKRKKEKFANSVVDMIFVSPDIKVLDYYCPQVDISDHLPLVVVLEI